MQAPQTLGGRSGEGGTREGLYGSSGPTLSKNQADSLFHYYCHYKGVNGSGTGKVILICLQSLLYSVKSKVVQSMGS